MRNFLVCDKNNNVYCGKCGALLDYDDEEIRRHEKECDVSLFWEAKPLSEIKAYTVEKNNEGLLFSIFQATGDIHNFKGIKWDLLYSCQFLNNGHSFKEKGKENLIYWDEMLQLGMLFEADIDDSVFNISESNFIQVVNSVYPGVGYIDNMHHFIERFLNKGFVQKTLDIELLKKIPSQNPNLNIGKIFNNKRVKFCQLKEIEFNTDIIFSCFCSEGKVEDGRLIPEYKKYLYVSKDFVYNPSGFDIYDFVEGNPIYGQFRYEKFQEKYPSVKLADYLNSGGANALKFLLAENNDFSFEIIGKAKLGYLADISKTLDLNFQGKNIKDIFGMPIKALRKLNNKNIISKINYVTFKMLRNIYNIQPAIFNFEITDTELRFFESQMLGKSVNLRACREDNPKSLFEYANYCRELSEQEFLLFRDYSNLCYFSELWPYKKFPERTFIKHAHDMMVIFVNEKKKAIESKNFNEVVQSEDYLDLINLPYSDFYNESNFVLLAPRTADDLVNESYQMRNCVRSYIRSVAERRTFILFLRKKSSKSNSFVTVEVNRNYELIQVKGKANSLPDKETKEWIRQWCKDKHIIMGTCRDL